MRQLLDHLDSVTLQRIRLQLALTDALREELPEPFRQDCWCSRIQNTTLTVTVNNASHASLIHYQQHELLKRINADFKEQLTQPLQRIRIRVAARHASQDEMSSG